MIDEEDKIVIKDEQGMEHTYYQLLEFFHKGRNKEYLIYTDNNKDKDGNLNIYSSIIKKEGKYIQFIPVEEEEDIEIVKNAIVQMKFELIDE